MPETITYRGPRVLVGALAHLLREEGVESTSLGRTAQNWFPWPKSSWR